MGFSMALLPFDTIMNNAVFSLQSSKSKANIARPAAGESVGVTATETGDQKLSPGGWWH